MVAEFKRALLVIDVQNEYFSGKLPVSYPANSLDNIKLMIQSAHDHQIPVILIQHTAPQPDSVTFVRGTESWKLHPDILAYPYDCIIEKSLPGSFTGTDLADCLKKWEIDTTVICGYMTQMCCDTTARQALHLGYRVEFISDATGTMGLNNYAGRVTAEELHRAILVTQAMRFSQVLTTSEWTVMLK